MVDRHRAVRTGLSTPPGSRQAQQLHRRPGLCQVIRASHRAVRPLHRFGVPPPRLPRRHRHPTDAGRGERAFSSDSPDLDKRARLIDALLDRPEFVDQWALFLGDLLQNRRERDHDVRGPKGVRAFHEWIREQVAANRPWDELARDVLTAKGTTTADPAGWLLRRHRRRERPTGEFGRRRVGGAGVSRHAHRLRPLSQSPARTLHAGRLLPPRRLLLPPPARPPRPDPTADDAPLPTRRRGRQAARRIPRRRLQQPNEPASSSSRSRWTAIRPTSSPTRTRACNWRRG